MKVKIKELNKDESFIGKDVTIQGWVKTLRHQKTFSFVEVNDGSCFSNFQVLLDESMPNFKEILQDLSTGASVSMTGEITLRGKVLPIGGIRDKVLAAHRAGIKTVILPKENERDLEDVPDEVKDALKFEFVEHLDQVLDIALRNQSK